ncbi:MAG: hypothetical protein ACUVT5_02050 [Candidatus Bathyarchaeales archaeon]
MTNNSYLAGLEDGLELALVHVRNADSVHQAVESLTYLLGLLKERKFSRLSQFLGVLKEVEKSKESESLPSEQKNP